MTSTQRIGNLYTELFESLVRFAMTRGLQKADAEDVVHDVFTRLLEKINEISPDKTDAHYLHGAVRKACINVIRNTSARNAIEDEIAINAVTHTTYHDGDSKLLIADIARMCKAALGGMPPQYRKAVQLKIGYGLTTSEITARTGTTRKIAQNNCDRGLRSLRKLLMWSHR